jgi:hypothetical protein
VEVLLFRRADIFDARKLEIGKLGDFDRRLGLGYWLEGTRRGGLDRQRLVRITACRCLPHIMRVDLRLAKACQVVVNSVFGIQTEVLGVGADESAIENAAREFIELFLFDGLQHAPADLGDVRNVVEREFLTFPRLPEFVSEITHSGKDPSLY